MITPQGGDIDINSVFFASKGNATDFGQDIWSGHYGNGGASSGVRGVWGAGNEGYKPTAYIRSMDISSGGLAIEFGQLLDNSANTYLSIAGSHTRGLWFGGYISPANSQSNVIQYVSIQSGGNTLDFGDMVRGAYGNYACSDCHGGLGGY